MKSNRKINEMFTLILKKNYINYFRTFKFSILHQNYKLNSFENIHVKFPYILSKYCKHNNVEQLIKDQSYQNSGVAIKKILLKKALENARGDANTLLKSDGSESFKLSNGAIAPASKFYEDINARYNEALLEKLTMENDGDPFKANALIQLEQAVNQQNQIIEANTQ